MRGLNDVDTDEVIWQAKEWRRRKLSEQLRLRGRELTADELERFNARLEPFLVRGMP